jgi:hypothetical protein
MTGVELTAADRESLRGLGQGQVPGAVEAILADHFDQWEWNYGERVRRLESQVDTLRAELAAMALAAVRDVRAAQR